MLDTVTLLQRPPKRALVDIVNFYNSTTIDPEAVNVTQPESLGGRRTRVVLSAPPRASAVEIPLYSGSKPFEFNRLDLAEFFAPVTIQAELSYPATTYSILDHLTQRFGFVFDEEDFYIEDIPGIGAGTYTLRAHPNSLRWVGSIDIDLTVTEDLNTIFNIQTLDGLWYFEPKTPLQNLYRVMALNGLSYADLPINIKGLLYYTELPEMWSLDELYDPVYYSDTSKSSFDMLHTALNRAALHYIEPEQVQFDLPQVLTGGDKNTSVLAIGTGIDRIGGEATLTYNRIDLNVYLSGPKSYSVDTLPTTLAEVRAAINAQESLNLKGVDVSMVDNGAGAYTVTAKPESLAWIGSIEVSFQLNTP